MNPAIRDQLASELGVVVCLARMLAPLAPVPVAELNGKLGDLAGLLGNGDVILFVVPSGPEAIFTEMHESLSCVVVGLTDEGIDVDLVGFARVLRQVRQGMRSPASSAANDNALESTGEA